MAALRTTLLCIAYPGAMLTRERVHAEYGGLAMSMHIHRLRDG